MTGLFVTGTDTGVGKTVLCCALLRALAEEGVCAAGVKPFQTGVAAPDDAALLAAASSGTLAAEEVCPVRLKEPAAPAVAARAEGKVLALEPVLEACRQLSRRYEALIVEGVGGLLVPLNDRQTVLDLAAALGLPLLIAARPGLGTINHSALTVKAAQDAGLPVAGIVFCHTRPEAEPHELAARTNAAEIQRLTGVPVIARLPYAAGFPSPESIRALAGVLRRCVGSVRRLAGVSAK